MNVQVDVNDVMEGLLKQITEKSNKIAILEAVIKQKDKLINELNSKEDN